MIRRNNLIILWLVFLTWPAFSQDPVRDLLKKAEASGGSSNNNLLVLFDSTQVDMQESGLTYVVNRSLKKALTGKGALDLCVFTTGYDPQSAYVEIRKVVVYKKDGRVIEQATPRVMDYPAPARAIYWGAREKMVDVGRVDPGDAVEVITFRKGFTYALLGGEEDDKYIPPMRGHFYDIVEFFGPDPVWKKVYQVRIPRDKQLQYEFYNGAAQVSCWIEKEKVLYTFTANDLQPMPTEPRMVALSDVAPKLLLSTSPDWHAKSTWFFSVNEDFGSFDSTPEIKQKVSDILKGARNEMDSVSRLTHWCADEIRYSGISMGCGEGFTLHKGEMTFTDRCGVCKDKAGMLITMLRAAGFKSYPAMTMAGSRIDYIPADQFNHCVTVVKLSDGRYHLLDPTWVPFLRELWSSAEQQQQYLMGIPEGADLETTPVSDPANHYLKIDGTAALLADGTLNGQITVIAEGQSDGAVRGLFRYSQKAAWYQNVEKELLRVFPQAQVTKVDYNNPENYLDSNIRITIGYSIPDFAIVSGSNLVFVPLTVAGIFKSFQGHLYFDTGLKERKYPFRDRCSRKVEIHESITLPAFKNLVRIPAATTTSGDAASYTGGYVLKGQTLQFYETSILGRRIYQPEEWPAFREVVEARNNYSEKPVIIEL
ncbi:MAG TPA: DUF3857 and transglutaminase domain-containing protein [Bacteroidales bacterium]|nr:DUF3857 and transglutaminase domain-containing protein [Bacteroidales bacterium]HPT09756.1 DUF3857 and transglutaminase domain-containing protein [Bacteroidales bacterium]